MQAHPKSDSGVWVLIPAAGAGERFGADVPKQFLCLAGQPLLHRTLRALWACPSVAGLAVAVPADRAADRSVLPAELRDRDDVLVRAGGATRTASVRAALAAVPDHCDLILVHDGARPGVSPDLVDRVVAGAQAFGACVPGLAPADTVKQVAPDGSVVATLIRDDLRLIQTPQGFRREVLERAYSWFDDQAHGPAPSDDAGLVEASGQPVQIVEGAPGNHKLTVPRDLLGLGLAWPRVGHGYDVHRLVEGRPLKLGGLALPFERGLLGHSDGDVALHALADALLGAAGLGDIGRLFPDDDERWRGADSRDLLARVVAQVARAGFDVASADLTIVAQRPRLADHMPAMAEAVATVLGLPAAAVNVKATTEEGLGLTGDGQAIAAHAVAVLVPGAGAPGGGER